MGYGPPAKLFDRGDRAVSISAMTNIWNTCCYQGGCLVLLLAMADHGEDDGTEIYPGLDLLAAKCRSSVRAVQEQIKKLRGDGVLKIIGPDGEDLPDDVMPAGGRGHKTEYRIDLERVKELHALHQEQSPECEHCLARSIRAQRAARKGAAGRTLSSEKRVQPGARKGEAGSAKGEDSRTAYRIEPSKPSLNLPPDAARAPEGRVVGPDGEPIQSASPPPSSDRMARLAKVIGPDRQKNHWFDGAYFREGSPLTIVLATRARCSRARDLFGFQLRDVFGDDLAFDFERQPVTEDG
jgi:hypothetical protein